MPLDQDYSFYNNDVTLAKMKGEYIYSNMRMTSNPCVMVIFVWLRVNYIQEWSPPSYVVGGGEVTAYTPQGGL